MIGNTTQVSTREARMDSVIDLLPPARSFRFVLTTGHTPVVDTVGMFCSLDVVSLRESGSQETACPVGQQKPVGRLQL